MALIISPPKPTETPVQQFFRETCEALPDKLQSLISTHKALFNKIWRNSDWTADEFFAAAGDQGERILMIGWANKQNIATFAQIQGLTLDDLLHPDDYNPPRQYTISGGVVTLAPLP